MLNEVGILNGLTELIMQCIMSVRTNVMWNGARSEYFQPQRGIRQGDPMSPYIFVLCMDKLSHLIAQEVEEGNWVGLRAGRRGPVISHLMFADDLLLFGRASVSQLECVLRVLNTFCLLSGHQVSKEKTPILFSRNVTGALKRELVQMLGV